MKFFIGKNDHPIINKINRVTILMQADDADLICFIKVKVKTHKKFEWLRLQRKSFTEKLAYTNSCTCYPKNFNLPLINAT